MLRTKAQVLLVAGISLVLCSTTKPDSRILETFTNDISKTFVVDFDESMEFDTIDPFNKRSHPIINFARMLYSANNPMHRKPQRDPLIPKIIHLIWLGPKQPPAIARKCLESIKKNLPDWEIRLWVDKDIEQLNLQNKKYFDEETNYGAKSDILRYELLYRFGGLYIDVDIEIIKSLDLLNHTYDFYAGLEASDNEAIIGNSIIACAPGHPILKDCIDQIKNHRYSMEEWKVVERTGPKHFEQSVVNAAKHCDQSRIMLLPKSYLYPINYSKRAYTDFSSLIKPETCCVHYWAGSWITNNK